MSAISASVRWAVQDTRVARRTSKPKINALVLHLGSASHQYCCQSKLQESFTSTNSCVSTSLNQINCSETGRVIRMFHGCLHADMSLLSLCFPRVVSVSKRARRKAGSMMRYPSFRALLNPGGPDTRLGSRTHLQRGGSSSTEQEGCNCRHHAATAPCNQHDSYSISMLVSAGLPSCAPFTQSRRLPRVITSKACAHGLQAKLRMPAAAASGF